MNNSICTLFDNILIDIHKFKSLQYFIVLGLNNVDFVLLKDTLILYSGCMNN